MKIIKDTEEGRHDDEIGIEELIKLINGIGKDIDNGICIDYGDNEKNDYKYIYNYEINCKNNIINISGKTLNYENENYDYEEEINDSFKIDCNKINNIWLTDSNMINVLYFNLMENKWVRIAK